MHVHDGAIAAIVEAKDGELDSAQFGQDDGRDSAAVAYRRRPCFSVLILGEYAEPGFGQVPGGRRGDAVAGDVQTSAQRGELAGSRAVRGQGASSRAAIVLSRCSPGLDGVWLTATPVAAGGRA